MVAPNRDSPQVNGRIIHVDRGLKCDKYVTVARSSTIFVSVLAAICTRTPQREYWCRRQPKAAGPKAPLHGLKASTAGSGKTHLTDIISVILTGRTCPANSAGTDRKEFESRLTGMLLGGYQMFSLDNCNGEIGGDLLCQN
jgi:hypothetical protein